MKKLILLSLLSLSAFSSYAQSNNTAPNDTITNTVPMEQWEYLTVYMYNTHRNAGFGEVEFKSHKDAGILNKYGREGWELVAITPIIAPSMVGRNTYTEKLVYTFKRRLQAKR